MIIKKVVWALFDDGTQSVKNSLDKEIFEVYSFGINDKKSVEQIDLSQDIDVVMDFLNKYPQPDIIVASPPCIAFSKASGTEKGMNAYLYYNSLDERNEESYIESNYIYENSPIAGMNKKDFAILSKKLVNNTLKIIENINVKYWYIENPRTSLIWQYINDENNYHNIVNYGAYDHPVKKPTIFLSNLKMDLKTDVNGKEFLSWDKEFTNKEQRSSIPEKLIKDIFNQFEENELLLKRKYERGR